MEAEKALFDRWNDLCEEHYSGDPTAGGHQAWALAKLVSESTAKAVEEEREACASLCDEEVRAAARRSRFMEPAVHALLDDRETMFSRLAAAIRSRKESAP